MAAVFFCSDRGESAKGRPIRVLLAPNATGQSGTLVPGRALDTSGPFFQALGTNGRSCVTCHDPAAGWSITPALALSRFETSGGLDPLFRPHDGADTPLANVTTVEARRSAYGMLLRKGLFRIGLPVPAAAEFELAAVDDPYGYASASELSLFRRPLPAVNLRFLNTVMWDGRESRPGATLEQSLTSQALNANLGHGQASAPTDAGTLNAIVRFELAQTSAQAQDLAAGPLDQAGGRGGPRTLAVAQPAPAPWLESYLATGSVWLGLSYGLALAFAATSFRTYRQERQCVSRNVAIGGVTLSGFVAVAGCFLVGCCGSPMLGVYLGLFGAKVLPFTKPFITLLTALSVLASWAWMKYAPRRRVSLPLCPDGKCALGNECG